MHYLIQTNARAYSIQREDEITLTNWLKKVNINFWQLIQKKHLGYERHCKEALTYDYLGSLICTYA